MGLWSRLIGTDDATMAHKLILIWGRAMSDMEAEIGKLPNETVSQQEERKLLRGFLAKTDSRVTARAHEPLNKGRKLVKKTQTEEVQVEET